MRFTYTYRSSDGQRHAAEIEAESRDDAFARVRTELGIKPIKVVAAEASPAEGAERESISHSHNSTISQFHNSTIKTSVLLIALIVLAGGGAWWWMRREEGSAPYRPEKPQGVYRQETREAFLKLIERAGALEDRCRAELKLLKLDNLHDYAWIERVKDVSPLYRELEKAQSIIDYTRSQAKELFRDVYSKFPAASANERRDAQRRYGELMDAIDAEEERMQSEHLVLLLLDGNRGAWRVEHGAISFTDAKVEEDFRFYSRPTDGSTARWKHDFGTGL